MDERDNKAMNDNLSFEKARVRLIKASNLMSNTEETNKLSAELSQLFKNNSDCYADTRIDDGCNMFEGEVVQAMTELKFIKLAESFASMRVEKEKESIRQFLISEGFEMLSEKI